MQFRWKSSVLSALVFVVLAVCTSGCNVFGALAYKMNGPDAVKAEYVPPHEPILVLAESYGQANDLQPYADQLAVLVRKDLKAHDVGPIVDDTKLLELRSDKSREFDKMKIPDVGRAVGAKQVVYIDLRECSFESNPGSDMFQGSIDARVRVVDVSTGITRWPDVGGGKPFHAKTDYVRQDARDTPLAVRNMMLEDLAGAISRKFYDTKPDSGLRSNAICPFSGTGSASSTWRSTSCISSRNRFTSSPMKIGGRFLNFGR